MLAQEPASTTGLQSLALRCESGQHTLWQIVVGMSWQCIVSLAILYRELGTLRWSAVRLRTWLQTPCDPRTD